MSFKDCITGRVKEGKLTPEKEADLLSRYNEIYKKYQTAMGDDEAAAQAAEDFVRSERRRILKTVENDMQAARFQKKVDGDLRSKAARIAEEKDQARPYFGLIPNKFLFGHPYARAAREFLQGVYVRHQSLDWQAHAVIRDLTDKFKSTHAGFKQDTAGFMDVVREIGGVDTKNPTARMYGEALSDLFKRLRDMHEAAGGVIGKLERYFPQSHEPDLVGAVKYHDWRTDLNTFGLDTDKMINPDTGLPMSTKELEAALQATYQSIKTGGLSDIAAEAQRQRGMNAAEKTAPQLPGMAMMENFGNVNMRRAPSRFIHFRDVEGFLAYNRKYGTGDTGLFHTAMGYISRMTRDIAIMQEMGPKPAALMKNLEMNLAADRASPATINFIKGMYKTLAGLNDYAGELPTWYKVNAAAIGLKRSAYFTGAAISALSDQFYIGFAAKMHGLSATKALGNYYKAFNPLDQSHVQMMRRHLFVSQAVSGLSLQGARFADTVGRNGMIQFLAGVTNRAGGLSFMTESGRAAPALELAAQLAHFKETGTRLDGIPPEMHQMAEHFGITAMDWEKMLGAEPHLDPDTKADFMFPENIASLGTEHSETATRFAKWFTELGNLGTNEPGLFTRTITTGALGGGDARPGTLTRALAQNVTFAKSFPITVMVNYTIPLLRQAAMGKGIGRGGQLAAFVAGGTLFGAMALQARQLINGEDPMDMEKNSFWRAAMLNAGGLGIFGDYMFGDYNRYGSSPLATALGPNVSMLSSLMQAVSPAQMMDTLDSEQNMNNTMGKLWNVAIKEVPVARLWYTRLIVERYLYDQVEKMLDPGYDRRMSRIEKGMQKRTGQGFWWSPGTFAPERAPDMGAVAGGHR